MWGMWAMWAMWAVGDVGRGPCGPWAHPLDGDGWRAERAPVDYARSRMMLASSSGR
jgi:hypothetical protein